MRVLVRMLLGCQYGPRLSSCENGWLTLQNEPFRSVHAPHDALSRPSFRMDCRLGYVPRGSSQLVMVVNICEPFIWGTTRYGELMITGQLPPTSATSAGWVLVSVGVLKPIVWWVASETQWFELWVWSCSFGFVFCLQVTGWLVFWEF